MRHGHGTIRICNDPFGDEDEEDQESLGRRRIWRERRGSCGRTVCHASATDSTATSLAPAHVGFEGAEQRGLQD